jgi:hypothetical protein
VVNNDLGALEPNRLLPTGLIGAEFSSRAGSVVFCSKGDALGPFGTPNRADAGIGASLCVKVVRFAVEFLSSRVD